MISPNATVCGIVDIGDKSWISAGATIINNLNICDDAIIGAGSVVVKNVVESAGLYRFGEIKNICNANKIDIKRIGVCAVYLDRYLKVK